MLAVIRSGTRRDFLKRSAKVMTGVWAGGAPALARAGSPNEKLGVGLVGVGGRGAANLAGMVGQRVVAICDVDEKRSAPARNNLRWAKFYTDYRRMVERKDIDVVVVSTPDHTHAPATMAALRAGKHVYCEKPLAHSVHEARKVAEMAAKTKLATQMGIQIHAGANYRRVVEVIRSGAIGAVAEVHVWCSGSYSPGDRPKDTPPAPKGLHYDLWLGPAPHRPYHPCYIPSRWRGWWDFGCGRLGDMGCHQLDLAHWALDLRHASAIEADGPPAHPESAPKWLIVRWEYPARDGKPPVKLTWYDGSKRPPLIAQGQCPGFGNMGILFVGEKGKLIADYERHVLLPKAKFADFKRPAPSIPRSIGHHKEWIKACKTGGKTTCGFDYAGPLTETVLLGSVAYRAGKRIEWDHKNLKITNAPEAMRFVRREYRKGWTL